VHSIAIALLLAWTASPQESPAPQSGVTVDIDGGARYTTQRTVTLGFHRAESDPKPVEMALSSDGTQWTPWRPFAETTKFDLPEGDGEKTVHVRFSDAAGKELPPIRAVIILDTTPPKALVSAPAKVPERFVTVTSNVPDAVAMQFTEDPGHWGPWEPYASPKTIPLSPGDGPKMVLARYRDEAGNISEAAQVGVEVRPDAAPDERPGVQLFQIEGAVSTSNAYTVRITVGARQMAESEILIDGFVS